MLLLYNLLLCFYFYSSLIWHFLTWATNNLITRDKLENRLHRKNDWQTIKSDSERSTVGKYLGIVYRK